MSRGVTNQIGGRMMRSENAYDSWRIEESHGDGLINALYVRDRAGLEIAGKTLPPLVPTVPRDPSAPDPTDQLAVGWHAWWDSLTAQLTISRNGGALSTESQFNEVTRGLGVPFREVVKWKAQRDMDQMRRSRGMSRDERLAVNTTVTAWERAAGRRASAFNLHIVVLPVAGPWALRLDRNVVFVSQDLRYDASAFDPLLTSILEEIA